MSIYFKITERWIDYISLQEAFSKPIGFTNNTPTYPILAYVGHIEEFCIFYLKNKYVIMWKG